MSALASTLAIIRYYSRLGVTPDEGARCSACGYSERGFICVGGLVAGDPILCADCDAIQHGIEPFAVNHIAGRHNADLSERISRTRHFVLTAMQQRNWPQTTLRNIDGSPFLQVAGFSRGISDNSALLALDFERLEQSASPAELRNVDGSPYLRLADSCRRITKGYAVLAPVFGQLDQDVKHINSKLDALCRVHANMCARLEQLKQNGKVAGNG